ncbi:DUF349 domain-containing protein [Marinimicrobium sp. ARAG 43.8]|uniref:DUF349 domain-containing protein n=1 Tax=Marinimicrobium sp. ARAG 43.8 TaxID=3418719 RepID=UPI003CE76340
MSPLKRLLGGRNRQPSLEEQVQSLDGRTDTELVALAQSDAQEALREAVVARLSYSPALLTIATDDTGNHRIQQAARKRLGQLLEDEALSLETLAAAVNDEKVLLTLSSYSLRAGQEVLARLSEPALLLDVAEHGASIQIRLAAAEKITTRPELERLQKAAQGRDKTVYKLAKQRLEAFKAEDAQQAQAEAQARVICDKLEQLLRLENDPLFDAKLAKLQQDWSGLPITAPEAMVNRYQRALGLWQQQCDARAAETAELAARDEAQAAHLAESHAQLNALEAELQQQRWALYQATTEQLNQSDWDVQLQTLGDAIAALHHTIPTHKALASLEQEHRHVTALLARLRERGSVPLWVERLNSDDQTQREQAQHALKPLLKGAGQWHDAPDTIRSALEALRSAEEIVRANERLRRKQVRELEGLTRQGLSAAGRGQVRRARGLHRATEEKRAELDHLPPHLSSKLEELDNAIERLSDWHEFAVTPKKEALIRSMQALEHNAMNPEELARKIHHLQDDWREVSKGVPHHDEDLWQQFQEASHRAFEPCKEFFEAQSREREHNQAKRDELIAQVRLYLDNYHWDTPVWKDVEHTLKQARREWRDAWPVPRQAIKAQEQTFEPLMDTLHAKLSEAYDAHRATKEALVEQARVLSEQQDLSSAIEGAKQLQAQWKQAGQCRPREDQALWKQFRQHCDAIFSRRQEQFAAADEARQAQAKEAEALIEQAQSLATRGSESPGERRTQTEQLKSAFRNLNNLPRSQAPALNSAFQKALKSIEQQQRAARTEQQERERQQLFNAAEAIRALELATLEGGDATAAREEAEIAMDAVERWPADAEATLRHRLEEAQRLSASAISDNEETLRRLCIRAEILAEQPTPEEDKARRMAFQMEQLQQGLGQSSDEPAVLLREWLSVSAVADPTYTQLLSRFQASLERR